MSNDIDYKALREELIGLNKPPKGPVDPLYELRRVKASNPELDKLLNIFYENPQYTNIASKLIKGVNILGHAGVPVAKELTEHLDNIAHKYATFDEKGAGMGWPGYTGRTMNFSGQGVTQDVYESTPNMMKIFLGQQENTFPESEVKPSSYTKGDPEQGWRSIKHLSEATFMKNFDARFSDASHDPNWHGKEETYDIKKLKKAVDKGIYNADKHAVKLTNPETFGFHFNTSVDLGNYTTSLGYDEEKGEYFISVTDVWDFDPEMYADVYGPKLLPEVIRKGKGPFARNYYPWKGKNFERYEDYIEDRNKKRSKLTTEASFLQATGKSVGVYDRYYLPKDYSDKLMGTSTEDKIIENFLDNEEGLFEE